MLRIGLLYTRRFTLRAPFLAPGVRQRPQGRIDGVVALEDGSLAVSSFGANAVHHVAPSGGVTEIVSDTPAADIGFDLGRSRVLIPQLDGNRLLPSRSAGIGT